MGTLVPTAFMLTSVIFACFTGASLMAPDGKYLYLGGTLLSGLSTLMWLGFANIFFRSQLLFQAHIWIGLAVFCLFIDFVQVFRKVLILLMQKESRRDERDNKKKQR